MRRLFTPRTLPHVVAAERPLGTPSGAIGPRRATACHGVPRRRWRAAASAACRGVPRRASLPGTTYDGDCARQRGADLVYTTRY